jgi:hypothetical protein
MTIIPAETSGSEEKDWRKEWEFCVFSIWDTSKDLLHAVKSYDMGTSAVLSVRRKVCYGFLSPLKIHGLARVWKRDAWVQCRTRSVISDSSFTAVPDTMKERSESVFALPWEADMN